MDLILHIGTEKSGSTSIQQALTTNRAALAEQGICYPALLGSPNHRELAAAAMGSRPFDDVQIQELAHSGLELPEYIETIRSKLRAEIDASRASTLLISCELFHGRLNSPESVDRLAELLGAKFSSVRVIVYLRRQDRMAVSLYSTQLRGGDTKQMFQIYPKIPVYYDFNALMSLYADRFGAENLIPRLFERGRLRGGDVVADFFRTVGLEPIPDAKIEANKSLSRQQARFLKLYNVRHPMFRDGKLNAARGRVVDAIIRVLPGRGPLPSRDEARAFQKQFDEVNEKARARFLPDLDRPTLFDEDFESYPEMGNIDVPLSEAEFMEFADALWRYQRRF